MKEEKIKSAEKVKPLFLGPKAENQDLYESVIIEAIRDNCFLRKNFHPEDKKVIAESDKISSFFQAEVANFKQKIQEILADLKKGVPLYHPRYFGHMHGDLLLPAVAAYFSTMLYNSNNVVGESSPATTKMEFDYIRNLCRMVGYEGFMDLTNEEKEVNHGGTIEKIFQSWGHLCSGGTSANIEALWVARNLKYYPLSVKLAIANPNVEKMDHSIEEFFKFFNESCDIEVFDKMVTGIQNVKYRTLFNLPAQNILFLKDVLYDNATEVAKERYSKMSYNDMKKTTEEKFIEEFTDQIRNIVEKYSVVELGVHGIHSLVAKQENEIPLPKLFITKSYHYSWDKAMDIVGIGRGNVVRIEMTDEFSMDIEDLKNKHKDNSDYPILAVVGIIGSSKQGSIDDLAAVVKFREKIETEEIEADRKSFYFHIDGAYGGYFPVLLWGEMKEESKENFGEKFNFKSEDDLRIYLSDIEGNINLCTGEEELIKGSTVQDLLRKNIKNLHCKLSHAKEANSYTIDPHKMGYVPYPAGGILYKDTRCKDFISYEPSYLNKPAESDEYSLFLGQWTLEGSRPGAAAAACYMANQILPFNQNGYGLLIRNTIQMANMFMALINKFNSDTSNNNGYQILPLYDRPETNVLEYVLVNPEKIKNIKYLNILTSMLYENFHVSGDSIIPSKSYMIAKEEFKADDLPSKVWESLKQKGNIENKEKEKLVILSSVFMNPLSVYIDKVEYYYYEFFKEMVKYANDTAMTEIMFEQIREENNDNRLKVLWLENQIGVYQTKRLLQYKSNVGQYLDIKFCELPNVTTVEQAKQEINKSYDVIILDLNLISNRHDEVRPEYLETALDLYKTLDDNQKSKVIFCSKFFQKKTESVIKKTLRTEIQFVDEERMKMITSSENNVKELNPLINSIFKVFNRK